MPSPLVRFLIHLLIFAAVPSVAGTLELTPAEREWLANHKTIRMSGPQAFPPFQYVDEDGVFKGMASDYLLHIAEQVGMEVRVVKGLPWSVILDKMKNREIDVLSCAAITRERSKYLNYTSPHLSFPLIIITAKQAPFVNDIYSLQDMTIAHVHNNATKEWLRQAGINFTTFPVSTPLEGLEAVSLGKADAVIENLAAASYLIEREGLTNLKIAAPTSLDNYALSIGVRKDWPELVSILNKGLAAIPQEKHNEIRQKWITVRYEHGIHLRDIVKWVSGVLLSAAILLALFYRWNRKLEKEIADRKQAEQEKENLIGELTSALEEIKTLRGILPICSKCKNIRDDKGYWTRIETYISNHSEADFSHSICPDCLKELYGDEDWFGKTGS